MAIYVFAKLYEILSLPFQDIEKPKHRRGTHARTDNVKTVYPQQTQFAGGGGYNNRHNFAFINMSYSLKSGTFGPDFEEKYKHILKKKSVLLMLVSVLSLQF